MPGTACIVVVHFGPAERTRATLAGLAATVPEDVDLVVVDNDPVPLTVDGDRVRVVRPGGNTGFAGGVRHGFDATTADVVILCNNDALPRPGWFAPLVAAVAEDGVGAAVPTILLDQPMADVTWEATGPVVFDDVRVGGHSVLRSVKGAGIVDQGRDQRANRGLRASAGGHFVVPVTGGPLTIALGDGNPVDLTIDGTHHPVPPLGVVTTTPTAQPIVNSIGLAVDGLGRGYDVGYLQPLAALGERGDPPLWSGCVVALRRDAVDQAGGFDARLFLYSEDLDLGWRMAAHGWRTRWVRDAVVDHEHMASTGHQSDLHRRLSLRNHLAVVAGDAPRAEALRLVLRTARGTLAMRWRDRRDPDLPSGLARDLLVADARTIVAAVPLVLRGLLRRGRRLPVAAISRAGP